MRNYSPVPYYLYCHSIELSLKAFLLAQATPYDRLFSLSHNLDAILREARLVGLDSIAPLSPAETAELTKANSIYATKGFEYLDLANLFRGRKHLPELRVLARVTTKLVKALETTCRIALRKQGRVDP